MFYTYAHTKPDGTIFYIGKGKDKRAWSKYSRNKHWNNIVAKYKNYNVEILANWDTEEEAFSHEILLISCFKDMGYVLSNMTVGGEGFCGGKHTEESKLKTSKTNKGMFGPGNKKHPQLGKTGENCPNFKCYIIATNIETGIETKFAGTKAIKDYGFNHGNVFACLEGTRNKHKGHTFKRLKA